MIEIVPMEESHLPELARLEALCLSSPWSENALREELHNPNALFLTALCQGKPAGYVGSLCVLDEGDICNVAVFPEYRRQGAATALLTALIAEGKRRGLAVLMLEVRRSNEGARTFYEKMGFETVGVRKNFYTAPKEDAILMNFNIK